MYRIYSALIEIVAAAVFIIPIWCIYNKLCFHSWKRTIIYMVLGFYFTAVLALVGFPNIASLKIDFAVNIIPFLDMVSDFTNACLNILLFVPFGFFLPILWDKFRNIKNIALVGFIATSLIEISQIFTFRTSDINDIITNTVGTIIGYFIVHRITDNFTKVTAQPQPSSKNKAGAKPGSSKFQIFFLQMSGNLSDHGNRSFKNARSFGSCSRP